MGITRRENDPADFDPAGVRNTAELGMSWNGKGIKARGLGVFLALAVLAIVASNVYSGWRVETALSALSREKTGEHLTLRTSHDRSRGIEVAVMPLRERCMNQLTLASFPKGVPHRWSIKHSHNMKAKLAEAKDSLSKLGNYGDRFEALVKRLLDVKVDAAKADMVLHSVIPARAKQADVISKIITLRDAQQVGFAGTGWGLVNAVSEYMDWSRAGGTAESRFLGALEGQTTKLLNKTVIHLLRTN